MSFVITHINSITSLQTLSENKKVSEKNIDNVFLLEFQRFDARDRKYTTKECRIFAEKVKNLVNSMHNGAIQNVFVSMNDEKEFRFRSNLSFFFVFNYNVLEDSLFKGPGFSFKMDTKYAVNRFFQCFILHINRIYNDIEYYKQYFIGDLTDSNKKFIEIMNRNSEKIVIDNRKTYRNIFDEEGMYVLIKSSVSKKDLVKIKMHLGIDV